MKTFKEFVDICEGSAIAGKLADLAQSKADKLFQGNRQWDPNRAKIQILQRISDLARARNLDKPEPRYAGLTIPPPGSPGKSANLPPRRPINSRGGAGDKWSYERDRGNKDQRLYDTFVTGNRTDPNLTPKERAERDRDRGKPRSSRGGSSILPNVGRGVETSPSGLKFTPGSGRKFGISGIGLAD